MKLSIVIPVFNEHETIEKLLNLVLTAPCPLADRELVLVDDCSTDGTGAKLDALAANHPNWNVIHHPVNRGKGAALHTAFAAASGDIILIQDADLEYDPNDYAALLKPILDDRADVVFGSRFIGGGAHRVVYFWHSLGNRFLTLLSNMFSGLNLTDMEVCYKVFRREVLEGIRLREPRFGFEPEFTAKVAKSRRWRIYEVPIAYYGRTYDTPAPTALSTACAGEDKTAKKAGAPVARDARTGVTVSRYFCGRLASA